MKKNNSCRTKAVRGPTTKINQSDRSIVGPIFSKYWTGYCPEWSHVVSRFQLEIKMRAIQAFVRRCFCCWPSFRQKKAWNHSVRKTSIGRLVSGNVPAKYVNVSGHKNIKRVLTHRQAVLAGTLRKKRVKNWKLQQYKFWWFLWFRQSSLRF